jgi:flagellar hook-associated protein 2
MSFSLSSITSGSSTNSGTGLGTGIDVNATVASILAGKRGQETVWQNQQKILAAQQTDLLQINSQISQLKSAFLALSSPTGSLATNNVTSSLTRLVSGSADSTAVAGSHTIVVQNLASTASYYSNSVASATTPLAQGSFTVKVGSGAAQTVTVDATDNTLSGLVTAINNAKIGVTASVVTDASGARLALVSQTSGLPGAITLGSNTTALTFTQANAATNAALTVDGVPVSTATNSVTGVIQGVTLNLNGADPNSSVIVGVSADENSVQAGIQTFVDAYNTIVKAVNSEFTYNATTQTGGALGGDSGLRQVQQQLLGDITVQGTGNGAVNSLADLGISMNDDGTLTVDTTKLSNVVSGNLSDVQNFFQSTATGSFAKQFNADVTTLTDSTQGPLYLELKGLQQTQTDLTNQINDFETNLAALQTELITTYSKLNASLEELPLLQQQLQQELGSLPSNSKN